MQSGVREEKQVESDETKVQMTSGISLPIYTIRGGCKKLKIFSVSESTHTMGCATGVFMDCLRIRTVAAY